MYWLLAKIKFKAENQQLYQVSFRIPAPQLLFNKLLGDYHEISPQISYLEFDATSKFTELQIESMRILWDPEASNAFSIADKVFEAEVLTHLMIWINIPPLKLYHFDLGKSSWLAINN